MPKQDRTGPDGQGAMTGRGLGPCGEGMRRGFAGGRGFGGGFGRRCWGRCPYFEQVNLTKQEEKKILEAELKEMEAEKQEIADIYIAKGFKGKEEKKDEKTRQMFLGLYNIDIYNYENFDIVLDISKSYTNPEGVTNLLEKLILDHNSQTSTFSSNFKGF